MEQNLEQEIAERLAKLPEDVQAALKSGDVPAHTREIGEKHGLHIDQVGLLEDETMLVMLGFASPGDFTQSIVEQLHITPEVASEIADEVSTTLFVPIRESMKKFMEQQQETKSSEISAPTGIQTQSVATPSAPAAPAATPAPTAPTTMPAADIMLSQKTISTATAPTTASSTTPTGAASYKTDPYREPPE
ncbi:MAG: hypothetical protein WCI89_00645 [bacterium]